MTDKKETKEPEIETIEVDTMQEILKLMGEKE